MGDLSGQTAAVIGGGRGLGRAAALAPAAHGAGVVIASRTAAELDAVAAGISRTGGRAGTVVADASQEPDAERIVGAALIKPLPEVTLAEWEHLFAMNTRSVFLTNRAALRPMLAAGRGLIVNVASRAGITGAPNVAAYTAAKAAVIGFSRALEVKAQGMRVACVAPAPMDTPMRWAATPSFDPARLLSTDAVVDLVLYLTGHPEVTLEDPVVPVSVRL